MHMPGAPAALFPGNSNMSDLILVINAGSSSLKFEVFSIGTQDALERQARGRVEGIGTHPRLVAFDANGATLVDQKRATTDVSDLPAALGWAEHWLHAYFHGAQPLAVGHRVVHGGATYTAPILIDNVALIELSKLIPLAPLHQPHNLEPMRVLQQIMPEVPQVACFDTAFHHGHSAVAQRFAIPEAWYEQGVRRYGFHGLSYEYIASRLPEVAPGIAGGRVIVAHLGSGASMCAMIDGKSVETTMGFTALDGLAMSTRPGQLDAGVVLHLLIEKQMTPRDLEYMLYHECGLKGLSGISADVRDLLDNPDPRAALALEVFVYRIGLLAGSLAAAMGGIDGFVFTAGMGENSPDIRDRVGRWLSWLGLEIDTDANQANGPCISRKDSAVSAYVVPTDEELMIGRHTLAALRDRDSKARQAAR
jgi:acetate kinase